MAADERTNERAGALDVRSRDGRDANAGAMLSVQSNMQQRCAVALNPGAGRANVRPGPRKGPRTFSVQWAI
jgi:hypothetical protein